MRAAAAVLLAAALLLAGCGEPGTGSAAPAYDGPVTVTRSGGIAGVRDTVVLQTGDGSWQRTERQGGATTGILTAEQLSEIQPWLIDPVLAEEATRPTRKIYCADGFDYELTVGTTVVRWQDCPPAGAPPTNSGNIARLLMNATS